MTYQVQNSDSTKTFIVSDNVVDDGSISLSLIGRNVSNYGLYVARNTIHHLENFANTIAPNTPLIGQIWYDKGNTKLRVWNGTNWVSAGGIELGNLTTATAGDFLYFNGTSWVPHTFAINLATDSGLTSAPAATLTSGSTLGVGNTVRPNTTQKFGASGGMYASFGATYIDYYTNGNTIVFKMMQNGTLHAENDIIAFSTTVSDQRLKTDIQVVENALAKLAELRGVEFTYTDGRRSAGLIAQDVEKVLPQAVTETELPLKAPDGNKYKVLQYDQIFSLLVEAVKELAQRVDRLEAR